MIHNIDIENYKCLVKEVHTLKPLTIIAGPNSCGKSTLIQSLLQPMMYRSGAGRNALDGILSSDFFKIRNRYKASKAFKIHIKSEKGEEFIHVNSDFHVASPDSDTDLQFEKDIFYISASRVANINFPLATAFSEIGVNGQYVFSCYERHKDELLDQKLIKDQSSLTLSNQVRYWLGEILEIPTELETEKISENQVKVTYTSDGLPDLSPQQLGTGVSYVAMIIIACLTRNQGQTLIIENPEIHLHPKAQAKLGEFFAFVAKAGIQLIIETHCEYIMHKVGYEIFKGHFNHEDAMILYKENIKSSFMQMNFLETGHYNKDFPEGFLDTSMDELIEME